MPMQMKGENMSATEEPLNVIKTNVSNCRCCSSVHLCDVEQSMHTEDQEEEQSTRAASAHVRLGTKKEA